MLSTYTGYNKDIIDLCRRQLIEKGRIIYEEGFYIFTKQDFVKPSQGRDSSRIYEREYAKLPARVREIIETNTLVESTGTSTGTTSGSSTGRNNNHNTNHNHNTQKTAVEAEQLATRLFKWIEKNYPNREHNEKHIPKWAIDIDKINRIDGYSWDVITDIIDWTQKDDFWHGNIKSGNKLRLQFENLLDRREDALKKSKPTTKVFGMPSESKIKEYAKGRDEDKRAPVNSEGLKRFQEMRKKLVEKKAT